MSVYPISLSPIKTWTSAFRLPLLNPVYNCLWANTGLGRYSPTLWLLWPCPWWKKCKYKKVNLWKLTYFVNGNTECWPNWKLSSNNGEREISSAVMMRNSWKINSENSHLSSCHLTFQTAIHHVDNDHPRPISQTATLSTLQMSKQHDRGSNFQL